MEDFDRKLNNALAYVWLVIMAGCIIGVIGWGAYWHLFTAGICWVMFKAMYIPKPKTERK